MGVIEREKEKREKNKPGEFRDRRGDRVRQSWMRLFVLLDHFKEIFRSLGYM